MQFHRYSEIFPLLDGDELNQLAEDIESNGQKSPIVIYEGQILDGRNRFRACAIAGIAADFEDYTGDDALGHVISLNLHRRHLSTSQRAMVAANIANMQRGDNQHTAFAATSQTNAGKLLNVSADSIQRANKVRNDGVPELVEAVTQGDISVNEASKIADLSPEEQRELVERRPFVTNNSGNQEWYTPSDIIDAARAVLGEITLDPASSETANKIVKAKKYYTKYNDGLTKKWSGNVWMNPPYTSNTIHKFTSKLVEHITSGDIKTACVLANNATETLWFQQILAHCTAVCFVRGRIKFIDPDGVSSGTPLQGQAIFYFGENYQTFESNFDKFGIVLRGIG